MKELSDSIKVDDEKVRELDEKIQTIMYTIPNIPNETVPDGDTDEDNVEIRKFMEPTKFDFEPKAHWDIGKDLVFSIRRARQRLPVQGSMFIKGRSET